MEGTLKWRFQCEDNDSSHLSNGRSVFANVGVLDSRQNPYSSSRLSSHLSDSSESQTFNAIPVSLPTVVDIQDSLEVTKKLQTKHLTNSPSFFETTTGPVGLSCPKTLPPKLHHDPKLYFLATTLPLSRYPPRAYPPRVHQKAMENVKAPPKHTPTAHCGMPVRGRHHPPPQRRQRNLPLARHRGIQSLKVKSPFTPEKRATWNWLQQDAGKPFSKLFQATRFEFTYPMSSHPDAKYGMLSKVSESKFQEMNPYRVLAPELASGDVIDLTSPTFPVPAQAIAPIGLPARASDLNGGRVAPHGREAPGCFSEEKSRSSRVSAFNFNDDPPAQNGTSLSSTPCPSTGAGLPAAVGVHAQACPPISFGNGYGNFGNDYNDNSYPKILDSLVAMCNEGSISMEAPPATTSDEAPTSRAWESGTGLAEAFSLANGTFKESALHLDDTALHQSATTEISTAGDERVDVDSSSPVRGFGTNDFLAPMASKACPASGTIVPEDVFDSEEVSSETKFDFFVAIMNAGGREAYLAQRARDGEKQDSLFIPESTNPSTPDLTSSETSSLPLTRVSTLTSTEPAAAANASDDGNDNQTRAPAKELVIVHDWGIDPEIDALIDDFYDNQVPKLDQLCQVDDDPTLPSHGCIDPNILSLF